MPGVLQRIVFVFLMAFLGFCAGMAVGSQFVPEGNGLAGPAIAFWYGVSGLVAGIIIALLFIRFLKSGFRKAFIIVVILSIIMIGFIVYRVTELAHKQPAKINVPRTELSQQETMPGIFRPAVFKEDENKLTIGSGIARPHLSDGKVIYFYSFLPVDMEASQMKPVDSIIIKKGKHHFEISYAPPWFFPEHLKLDYDILLLQVLTISQNWMEVVVNKQTEQTHWISAADADFIEWSTFLLHVYDVELIDPDANPLRVKPLDYAGIVATTPQRFSLRPLAIRGDWMLVSTHGLADRIVPTGWIRWRKDDKLLVRYSLLS